MNSGADLDVSIFSQEGRVFQVEYAVKAIENASDCIGICCKDGVVVACEKIFQSKMIDMGESSRRNFAIDYHAGVCVAGHLPDGRMILSRARDEAKQMRDVFGTPITGQVLARRVADFMHVFTKYGSYRPFGVASILASYGDDGPQLFVADPAGNVAGYHAIALGHHKTLAKSQLETIDFSNITCEEAVKKAAAVLYDVHDYAKDKIWDVEFSWVCDASKRRFMPVPKDLIPAKPTQQPAGATGGAVEQN